MMYTALVRVGPEEGKSRTFVLCQIDSVNSTKEGLTKLKEKLFVEGIEAQDYLGEWLKWKHSLFWVQGVGSEEDLPRMLTAVRALEKKEEESIKRFEEFIFTRG